MKASEVTETGFYWFLDRFARPWTVTQVSRENGEMFVEFIREGDAYSISEFSDAEMVGPLVPPQRAA